MIDGEFSRLILAPYAIPYREEQRIFSWASVLALLHGFTFSSRSFTAAAGG